jgi:hypothetical protein
MLQLSWKDRIGTHICVKRKFQFKCLICQDLCSSYIKYIDSATEMPMFEPLIMLKICMVF